MCGSRSIPIDPRAKNARQTKTSREGERQIANSGRGRRLSVVNRGCCRGEIKCTLSAPLGFFSFLLSPVGDQGTGFRTGYPELWVVSKSCGPHCGGVVSTFGRRSTCTCRRYHGRKGLSLYFCSGPQLRRNPIHPLPRGP